MHELQRRSVRTVVGIDSVHVVRDRFVLDDDGELCFHELHRLRGGTVRFCDWKRRVHPVRIRSLFHGGGHIGLDKLHKLCSGNVLFSRRLQLLKLHGREIRYARRELRLRELSCRSLLGIFGLEQLHELYCRAVFVFFGVA